MFYVLGDERRSSNVDMSMFLTPRVRTDPETPTPTINPLGDSWLETPSPFRSLIKTNPKQTKDPIPDLQSYLERTEQREDESSKDKTEEISKSKKLQFGVDSKETVEIPVDKNISSSNSLKNSVGSPKEVFLDSPDVDKSLNMAYFEYKPKTETDALIDRFLETPNDRLLQESLLALSAIKSDRDHPSLSSRYLHGMNKSTSKFSSQFTPLAFWKDTPDDQAKNGNSLAFALTPTPLRTEDASDRIRPSETEPITPVVKLDFSPLSSPAIKRSETIGQPVTTDIQELTDFTDIFKPILEKAKYSEHKNSEKTSKEHDTDPRHSDAFLYELSLSSNGTKSSSSDFGLPRIDTNGLAEKSAQEQPTVLRSEQDFLDFEAAVSRDTVTDKFQPLREREAQRVKDSVQPLPGTSNINDIIARYKKLKATSALDELSGK